jgi:hypothetical protein
MVIQVVAMSLVTAAVPALRDGSPVDVSVGAVTSLGLTTLAMAALAVFAKLVLTKALSRPGLWIIIALVGLAVCIAPAPIWRQPAPPLPAAPMLIIGLLIMAAGAVWIARQANRDPVVLPQGKALTDSRRPSLILALLVPGATIVLAAFIWLVG